MAVKKSSPLVSIVILNWNGLEDTKLCLEYARKLDYPNYEIIVVDNGSSKDQKEYLSKVKDIVYIDNPKNRGFAGGQVDGFNSAKGDYILLLNNDAVIQSDYLKEAMPIFKDSSVAVVGGRSYFWNDDEPLLNLRNRFYSYMTIDPITAETTLNMSDYGTLQEANVVSGSAVIVRREVIDKVGYLWEDFFAYYEETDLFARIKRAGYKIMYNPKLHIWHKNGASSGAQSGSFFFYYHIFRNRYMFAVRNFDDTYFKLFKKSYYKLAAKSVSEMAAGKSQRTLAKAYLQAIKYIRSNEYKLAQSRKELQENLTKINYSHKIICEQTSISVVLDASKLSKEKVLELSSTFSQDTNPLHEYVIVTNHFTSKDGTQNIRYVNDRNFFNVHPINIGCVVSRGDWIFISNANTAPNIEEVIGKIADNYLEKASVIDIANNSLVVTRQFYNIVGGLQKSATKLEDNILRIRQYAHVDDSLLSKKPPKVTPTLHEELEKDLALGRSITNASEPSRREQILARHYRLYQLDNLLRWAVHPNIPLRLKAGRTKNLILSSIRINKHTLATELKHIRNEVAEVSQKNNIAASGQDLQKQSNEICKNTIGKVKDIPVFIICFERVNDLKRLIAWLESVGMKKIVLIDNDSTYQPLLDFYATTKYQVLPLGQNIGHTAPWTSGIVRTLAPGEMYIVTDPDVIPDNDCPADAIAHFLDLHIKYPYHNKIGFSLKINDLPDHYPLKNEVVSWESQFWNSALEEDVYEAGVDTTFALYKPFSYTYTLHPSIRTGGAYTARHAPWYANPRKKSEEEVYYRMRADSGVTSWNVDELPERYKKEMKNAKE